MICRFPPTITFSEYWMPVREIGGISRADLAGVATVGLAGQREGPAERYKSDGSTLAIVLEA